MFKNRVPQFVSTSQEFHVHLYYLSFVLFIIFFISSLSSIKCIIHKIVIMRTCDMDAQFALIHLPIHCPMARYNICITTDAILVLNLGMCQRWRNIARN